MLELSADAGRRVHATTGAGEQSLVGVARLDGAWRGDETKDSEIWTMAALAYVQGGRVDAPIIFLRVV